MKWLIVKTSSLGDIVHTFPVVEVIRHRDPQAEIGWVVEEPFAGMVEAHPEVTRVHVIASKRWKKQVLRRSSWTEALAARTAMKTLHYEVALDLQGNMKSALVLAACGAKQKVGYGLRSAPEWPNVWATSQRYNPPTGRNVREDYLFLLQSFLGDFSYRPSGQVVLKATEEERQKIGELLSSPILEGRPKVLVCPGSQWLNKQVTFPALASFLTLLQEKQRSAFLWLWGNEGERQMALALQQRFPTTSLVVERRGLPAVQQLMRSMDLVVAMDSLPLHLAATTSTPTYGLFGPSSSKKYAPLGAAHRAFQGTCPYGKTFDIRCSALRSCKTGACLRSVSGEALFQGLFTPTS